jgi:hypothetical protein
MATWIRIRIPNADPDPEGLKGLNRQEKRIKKADNQA